MEMKNEMKSVVKQVVDFQKSTLDTTFNTVAMFQDQTEKLSTTFIDQNPVMPQQAKNALNDWVELQKKARNDYKRVIDESFKNLEGYFSEASK